MPRPGFADGSPRVYAAFGSRVSRVASGRQNSRTGAYGEVPAPGRDVQPRAVRVTGTRVGRVPVQALGAAGVEVAVGHDRALERQADLAAVGVPGEGEVVAVAGVLVEHPEVRRVRHPDPQVDVRRRRPGDRVEVVVPQVRVVDADERERGAAHLEARRRCWSGRSSRAPSKAARRSRQGSLGVCTLRLAVVGEEVPQRVAQRSVRSSRWSRRRRRPGTSSSRPKPSTSGSTESWWARLSPVLTTRSGSRSASEASQRRFVALGRRQVQVADVQHLQRPVPGGEHRRPRPGVRRSCGPRSRRSRPACPDRPAAPSPTPPPATRSRRRASGPETEWEAMSQGCHNGQHERLEGPAADRPDRLDQGARRAALLHAADGADRGHQRRGRGQGGPRAQRRGRAGGAHQRVQEAARGRGGVRRRRPRRAGGQGASRGRGDRGLPARAAARRRSTRSSPRPSTSSVSARTACGRWAG